MEINEGMKINGQLYVSAQVGKKMYDRYLDYTRCQKLRLIKL